MAVLAVACSLPAGASAGTTTLKGETDTHGIVAFELKRKPSGVRKVVHFRWRDFPIGCYDGPHEHRGEFYPPWSLVSERGFHERAELVEPNRTGFAEVYGSFPRDWRHAKGTLEVSGDTSEWDDCQSGVIGWSAKRI